MLRNLLFIILSLSAMNTHGQDSSACSMIVSVALHKGFIIAHRPMIIPLQQEHAKGLEACFLLPTDGSREWHRVFGMPEMGLSLAAYDLGNKNQLGTGITLIPYLDFPLAKSKRAAFDLKFGWGIGYVEKIFDADDNYKNIAIGSHLNYALILQPRLKIKIAKHVILNGGLSITHFSNGSIATPNLGLNLVSVHGGLAYQFGKLHPEHIAIISSFVKSRRLTFFAAGALKQIYPADGKNYFAGTLSGNQSWQLTRKSAFGFGCDVFYDNSTKQKFEERNREFTSDLKAVRFGIHGSYELVISKLSFIINMGGYLYSELLNDGSIYQRVGIRYRLNEKIFALMQLKTHWGKADFIEWGIGLRIDKYKSR